MKLSAIILISTLIMTASIHAMEKDLPKLFDRLRDIMQQQEALDSQKGAVNLAILSAIGRLPQDQRANAAHQLWTLQGIPAQAKEIPVKKE